MALPDRRAPPVLLVHGGAWSIPGAELEAHEVGVKKALAAGFALLNQGASALDAVEAAVAALEDDEAFDAGRGSFLNRDGRVQLDALLMDGASLRAGGVGCVERLKNPIHAARLVMEKSPHVYLVGAGAEEFAKEHGMAWIKNSVLVIDRERRRLKEAQRANGGRKPDGSRHAGNLRLHNAKSHPAKSHKAKSLETKSHEIRFHDAKFHDTVGAVALDAAGNLAAATSTGGTLNKIPGRVGDSSLIGCGCYADNQSAAASLTGWGEPIMRLVLGKWACDRVQQLHPPEEAAEEAMGYLHARLQGHGGIILLDRAGRFGLAHNTPYMPWGISDQRGIRTGTKI
jgi:L-asparaginase / beta-aspartyl-peptidase